MSSDIHQEGVVFSLGPNIYHWNHEMDAPVLLRARPEEVSAFTLNDGVLIDGCTDGKVRATMTDSEIFSYPGEEVIGVNIAERAGDFERQQGQTRLLDNILAQYKLDPNQFGKSELVVTTQNNNSTKFFLGNRLLAGHTGTRSGVSQSLSTYRSFFWSNSGRVYTGFEMDRSNRYYNDDFVKMVPMSFQGDYLIWHHSDLPIEHVDYLQTRGKNGRILWTHNWKVYGCPVFAAFYTWPAKSLWESYLLFGCLGPRPRKNERSYAVYMIPVQEFAHGKPKLLFETEVGADKRYGYANPSIAHHSLLHTSK